MDRVAASMVGSAVVLAACAYFTRAGGRRLAAALAGGVAAALLNIAVDVGAHAAGWWRYPQAATPYAPLWYYSGAVLGFAAIALLIWRLTRRYGGVGAGAALVALMVLFPLRDARVAASSQIVEFGAGPVPWIADRFAAVAVAATAVAVMRLLAGPATRDALARS
jgi:hypothetical protein